MKKNMFVIRWVSLILSTILLSSCATSDKPPEPKTKTISDPVATVPSNQFRQFPAAHYHLSSWKNLPAWENDSLEQAWQSWQRSCQYFNKATQTPWQAVCKESQQVNGSDKKAIKDFYEKNFQVWEIRQARDQNQYLRGSQEGLITGYYEPILKGSLTRQGVYQTPLYKMPPSWHAAPSKVRPARAELLQSGALKGLEIAWVEDPVAAAFMQIQGSGKILLDNKKILRLGYAGTNNQTFVSYAQWLIQQKQMTYSQASMQAISSWAKNNPTRVNEMLNVNPRFIFFKVLESTTTIQEGPIGSIGVPLTAGRSIAVDWQSVPRGAPVYISTTDPQTSQPLQRLVFAQDTGSAIVGGVRADYFWGTGDLAGDTAGKMKHTGRMWVILPVSMFP